jgi:hypothetical protein
MIENRPLVYLACPYSDPDPAVREARFHASNRAAAKLMKLGYMVFAPISHTHPIAVDGDLPKGWDFWEQYDRAVLSCCNRIGVLKLPGWDKSVGVAAELKIASEMGIVVEYLGEEFSR